MPIRNLGAPILILCLVQSLFGCEVFSSGEGNSGVQNAAFDLPNDERVVKEKGSMLIMGEVCRHPSPNENRAGEVEGRASGYRTGFPLAK